MSIKLVRDALRDSFEKAKRAGAVPVPHAGLLLQCGYLEHEENDPLAKSRHIESVCQAFDHEFHGRAYQRWCQQTSDSSRFRSFSLALESRLLIGLSGGGLMETGCAISHSHGAPYLPGSSIKGVVAAYARELLCGLNNREDLADEVFGTPPDDDWPEGRSGLVAFYDAWWEPKSAKQPFVAEIVTSHHPDYYSPKGPRKPPSDFDSPVPNAQIAVEGAFRFTLAGPVEWLDLAEKMTISALTKRGLGARTRSGYGYFFDVKAEPDLPASPWKVEFLCPAFLGNAEQNGQWRTPPFKALLRQWWRVVWWAKNSSQGVCEMRKAEAKLFGAATDHGARGGATGRSQVRLRLSHWGEGKLNEQGWGEKDIGFIDHSKKTRTKIPHPEVSMEVGPLLYLGYGPLVVGEKVGNNTLKEYPTLLKKGKAAINAGESAILSIAVTSSCDQDIKDIQAACKLIDLYGTLGGRSRNGWGSFRFSQVRPKSESDDTSSPPAELPDYFLDWTSALSLDWPHGIGKDEDDKALIWETGPHGDWESVMRELAEIKIGLRTGGFKFESGGPHKQPQDRHWLSYPVKNHPVADWKRKGRRLPNSLRFKLRRNDDGKLRGVIFHMPCKPRWVNDQSHTKSMKCVWQKVHSFLDENKKLRRVSK